MKSPKNKEDLIETSVKQIETDVHCGHVTSLQELVMSCSIEKLIAYLPEDDQKKFKHLDDREFRTENVLNNLIKQYPNDTELGREIRKRYGRTT